MSYCAAWAAGAMLPRVAAAGKRGLVAIFDDLGGSSQDMERIYEITRADAPWVAGLMPGGHAFLSACDALRKVKEGEYGKNLEVILHLAMEPVEKRRIENKPRTGGYDASCYGENFGIYTRDSPEDAAKIVEDNLYYVNEKLGEQPGALKLLGVNNHMGSAVMQDEEKLRAIASVLSKHGLLFIDSGTYPNRVKEHYAHNQRIFTEAGARWYHRHYWLDTAFDQAVEKAQTDLVIGIGHIGNDATRKAYCEYATKNPGLFVGLSALE